MRLVQVLLMLVMQQELVLHLLLVELQSLLPEVRLVLVLHLQSVRLKSLELDMR
jgi:hypothetical protein